jgi:flagellar motor component MotA
MFAIIVIVVVFGCVVGGYLMEHGNLETAPGKFLQEGVIFHL